MNSTATERAHTGNQKFTKNFSENKVDKIVVDCCANDADDSLMAPEYQIFDYLRVLTSERARQRRLLLLDVVDRYKKEQLVNSL
jgi:hypothetical protein